MNQSDDDQDPSWQPVPSTDVIKHVNNKQSLYDACVRNDFLLPSYKDSIVTFEFLELVIAKKIWLPKAADCVMYSCVDVPTKVELA